MGSGHKLQFCHAELVEAWGQGTSFNFCHAELVEAWARVKHGSEPSDGAGGSCGT